jgi:hypothetical protein
LYDWHIVPLLHYAVLWLRIDRIAQLLQPRDVLYNDISEENTLSAIMSVTHNRTSRDSWLQVYSVRGRRLGWDCAAGLSAAIRIWLEHSK